MAITVAFISTAASAFASGVNTDYITPAFTFSPNYRYGVMVPVVHDEGAQEPDDRMNKVVELRTHRIVAVVHAEPSPAITMH